MTTATDTFRQHLQETQAIHFLPYVGDGYADARPRILMIGEATTARHRTEPTERTLTGSCAGRSKTPPKATATTGSATSATSPPCSPGTLTVVQRGVGYRGLRRILPAHGNGNAPQPVPRHA